MSEDRAEAWALAAGTGGAGTHWGACGRGGCGVKGGLDAARAH